MQHQPRQQPAVWSRKEAAAAPGPSLGLPGRKRRERQWSRVQWALLTWTFSSGTSFCRAEMGGVRGQQKILVKTCEGIRKERGNREGNKGVRCTGSRLTWHHLFCFLW
ncbi:hypothetical protein GDO81_028908 [Engystomops pustulosus]|uniref:Uncharacterized protein n=1 Tax=Engystomops pustulosus TaxID=76066 RepID=A0AAV6ZIM2_ENGPU|nr:hypothetical protein GDO81_028908 [Engystomops pustulosus]